MKSTSRRRRDAKEAKMEVPERVTERGKARENSIVLGFWRDGKEVSATETLEK